MDINDTRVAVVGAGAIGGVVAAGMAKAGWNVELVCKHREIAEKAASVGLHVLGVKGEAHVPVTGVEDVRGLSGAKDVVFLATKANDCVSSATALLPFLKEAGAVVSLQNGICEDAIAQVIGPRRVIRCVVSWGATMRGPAELEVTSRGEFVIGSFDDQPDGRLDIVRQMLESVETTRISQNMIGEQYSKLMVNSCINSLGAITGQELGKILASRAARDAFIVLIKEAMAVAVAMGMKVEPGGGGKLDFYRFVAGSGAISNFRRHLLIRLIGFKYRRLRSSSLQSLERGLKTEVDFLNGYICDRGREHGVPTPLNDTVVAMIKEIEEGRRRIAPENLGELPVG
ncbi:MAG: 2-dehydropantoate 2-reductase [Pseudomonadota bacterium]